MRKRKHPVEVDLEALRISRDLFGNRSPTSVLENWGNHCRVHCRDFSDCLKFHTNLVTGFATVKEKKDLFQELDDVLHLIIELLDARSLARCGLVSKRWRQIAHSDALWADKCANLWRGKQIIPAAALAPGIPKVTAYAISMKDSKRTLITLDELCRYAWEFRFKDVAPQYWLNLDPSRRGDSPMRRFFHPDGSHTAGFGDSVWGGHESSYFVIDEEALGHRHVRINHWPKMVVSRTHDWGWELSNNFYVYRSLP